MKIRYLILPFVLGLALDAGAAPVRQPSSLGLGFMVGSPTGLTGKYWLGGSDAIDAGLGFGPGFRVQASYLWGLAQLLRSTGDAQLDFYVGLGGLVGSGRGWCGWYDGGRRYAACGGDPYLGARLPVGIDLRLRQAPLSFGFEIAPAIAMGPHGAGGFLDALLFARVVL